MANLQGLLHPCHPRIEMSTTKAIFLKDKGIAISWTCHTLFSKKVHTLCVISPWNCQTPIILKFKCPLSQLEWGIVCFSTINGYWITCSNAWKSLLWFCYCVIAINRIFKLTSSVKLYRLNRLNSSFNQQIKIISINLQTRKWMER